MLKRLIFSFATIIVASSVFAQDIVFANVQDDSNATLEEEIVPKSFALSIGPKIGGNYSFATVPDDLNLEVEGNFGYSAGLAVNVRFGKRELTRFADTGKFGVQLEALYSMHALTADVANINMNCFEVPLLLQWWFLKDLCIELGPTFTGSFATSPEAIQYNNKTYGVGELKGYDVMLTVGAEYKSHIGFNASLRYNMGNSNLAGNFQTKVSTISLGIGWLFSVVK